MTNHEHEEIELELQRLRPAPLPPQLIDRLKAQHPLLESKPCTHKQAISWAEVLRVLRWWPAAATAMAALALLVFAWSRAPGSAPVSLALSTVRPAFVADEVQIDRHLVAAYDAVATLPEGEPVRFRCWEWLDEVTMRDRASGIVIQQSIPRFEAVPVEYEIY
jgi:hypothetical protein